MFHIEMETQVMVFYQEIFHSVPLAHRSCTCISNASIMSYFPLVCVVPLVHTLRGWGDKDINFILGGNCVSHPSQSNTGFLNHFFPLVVYDNDISDFQ